MARALTLLLCIACGLPSQAFADAKLDWFKTVLQVKNITSTGVTKRDFSLLVANASTNLDMAKYEGKLSKDVRDQSARLVEDLKLVNEAWSAMLVHPNVQYGGGFLPVSTQLGQATKQLGERLQPTVPFPADNGQIYPPEVVAHYMTGLSIRAGALQKRMEGQR